MKDCLKLARLDIISIGSGWLIFTLVYAFVFNIFLIYWGIGFTIMCISSQVIAMMAMWSFFGFQERDKLIILYGSLPVSIKKIVLGRYVSMVLICSIFFIKDVVMYICLSIFQIWHWDFTVLLQSFSLSILVFSIITTGIAPLFKFGLMKGIAWFAIIYFIFIMSFSLLTTVDVVPRIINLWYSYQFYFGIGAVILSCIIIYFSYRIAIAAYRSKNWT